MGGLATVIACAIAAWVSDAVENSTYLRRHPAKLCVALLPELLENSLSVADIQIDVSE